MNLLRSDQEVALNELLVAVKDSVEHLRYAADFLKEPAVASALREIGARRETLGERLAAVIRALGDQPATPDVERQSLEQLAQRLGAVVSHDPCIEVLEQRLIAEQHLARLVADARNAGLDSDTETLLGELDAQIRTVTEQLQTLLRDYHR